MVELSKGGSREAASPHLSSLSLCLQFELYTVTSFPELWSDGWLSLKWSYTTWATFKSLKDHDVWLLYVTAQCNVRVHCSEINPVQSFKECTVHTAHQRALIAQQCQVQGFASLLSIQTHPTQINQFSQHLLKDPQDSLNVKMMTMVMKNNAAADDDGNACLILLFRT